MKKLSVWIVLNIEEQLSTDLQNLAKNTFIIILLFINNNKYIYLLFAVSSAMCRLHNRQRGQSFPRIGFNKIHGMEKKFTKKWKTISS